MLRRNTGPAQRDSATSMLPSCVSPARSRMVRRRMVPVFGQVGQVTEIGKGADHAHRLVGGQAVEQLFSAPCRRRGRRRAGKPPTAGGPARSAERGHALLFPDHIAPGCAQQANVLDRGRSLSVFWCSRCCLLVASRTGRLLQAMLASRAGPFLQKHDAPKPPLSPSPIATRESRLACGRPNMRRPCCVRAATTVTAGHDHAGDQILDRSLSKVGGKACSSRNSKPRWPTAAPTLPCTRSRTCPWCCRTGLPWPA